MDAKASSKTDPGRIEIRLAYGGRAGRMALQRVLERAFKTEDSISWRARSRSPHSHLGSWHSSWHVDRRSAISYRPCVMFARLPKSNKHVGWNGRSPLFFCYCSNLGKRGGEAAKKEKALAVIVALPYPFHLVYQATESRKTGIALSLSLSLIIIIVMQRCTRLVSLKFFFFFSPA